MIYTQCSFRGFCDSYNNMNAKYEKKIAALYRKRLAEAFYAFHLVQYYGDFNLEKQLKSIFDYNF